MLIKFLLKYKVYLGFFFFFPSSIYISFNIVKKNSNYYIVECFNHKTQKFSVIEYTNFKNIFLKEILSYFLKFRVIFLRCLKGFYLYLKIPF